jgi:hypothetical protein
MDIVLHVADTDGGAHVDPSLEESYSGFRGGDFLGVRAAWGPGFAGISLDRDRGVPIPGAPWAAIRTIAHETLLSLRERVPRALKRPYEWKQQ